MRELMDKRLAAGIAVVLLGLSAASIGEAHADEPTPAPAPTTTAPTAPTAPAAKSSTDELADMVMDVLEGQ